MDAQRAKRLRDALTVALKNATAVRDVIAIDFLSRQTEVERLHLDTANAVVAGIDDALRIIDAGRA